MSFSNKEKNQLLATFLQEERLKQQLTLEEISIKTGVPYQHLKSVEAGAFEKFDAFYLKMYLKKYASTLNLNVDEVFSQYQEIIQPMGTIQTKRVHKTVRRSRKSSNKNGLVILALILVIGISGATVLKVMPKQSSQPDLNPPAITNPDSDDLLDSSSDDLTTDETEGEAPSVEQEELEVPNETTTITRGQTQGITTTFDVITTADTAKLTFVFTADCWMNAGVYGAETVIPQGMYYKDDVVDFVLTDEMLAQDHTMNLNIGNVLGVTLSVNDETVEFPEGGAHQNIALTLTKE